MPERMKIKAEEFKILIVDDIPSNILLLKTILKKENFQTVSANGGLQALLLIEQECPDLILLDIMMPDLDGYQVLERIKQNVKTDKIPVILLTALNEPENIVKGFRLGASDYVSKPFRTEELIIRIHYQLSLLEAKRIILKQNKQLEELIISRDKMYSVISHDLRAPIGSLKMINNALATSIKKDQVDEDIYDMIQLMNGISEDTYTMLDNLLKWTKVKLGNQKTVKEDIELDELITNVNAVFTSIANVKEISLKYNTNIQSVIVYADREMIKSVIRNLISNAIKFSNRNSRIEVQTEIYNGYAVTSVCDHGKGMSIEIQNKLLDQVIHTTTFGTENEKGSGVGLLLCKDFIELHNGKLWFESAENEGSTFYFSLPLKIVE